GCAHPEQPAAGGVGRRSGHLHGVAASDRRPAFRPRRRRGVEGARPRLRGGDRGCPGPLSGAEDPAPGFPLLMGLNLSEWALKHRSFVVYLMIAASLAGAAAFYQLGREEDPPFTGRTRVVAARWPGATMDETLKQVTERLERQLQETPYLDFLRSFTRPGATTIFVNLLGKTSAAQVEDTWYQVRKNVGDMRHTLPQGVVGPFFDDAFGDV